MSKKYIYTKHIIEKQDQIDQAKMFLLDQYMQSANQIDRKEVFNIYQNYSLKQNKNFLTKTLFFRVMKELFKFEKDQFYCERIN